MVTSREAQLLKENERLRKRVEESLHFAQNERLRLGRIIEKSLNEIYIFDSRSYRFLIVNQGARDNLGYSMDELRELTPLDIKPEISPDEFARLIRPLRDCTRETVVFQTIHLRKDGSSYPVEVHLQIAEYESRAAFVAIILDITDRKLAENAAQQVHEDLEQRVADRTRALRASEERFKLAVRGTTEGIWDRDILTDSEWWSDQYYALLGYEAGEIDADHQIFLSMLHPDDRTTAAEALQAHLKDRVPFDIEYRLLTKSGDYRWFRSRGQAEWDETGKPVRMAGAILDITNRKQTITALRESEQRFRTVFEQAAIGMAVLETNTGRFVRSNQMYCNLLGYSHEELTSKTFEHVTHPDDLQEDLDNMQRLINGEIREFTMEKRYYRKDGSLVWVSLTVSANWDPGEEPRYHIAIIEDISERKQAEAQLRAEQQLLRRLINLQEEERRMVAHDIHDGFIQDVVGAKMQLEAASARLPAGHETQESIEISVDLLVRAVAEGRRMIRDLRPMVLDEAGIIESIQHLLADEQRTKGLVVAFEHDVRFDRLDPRLEGAVFRVVQEALNNVKQHGQTNRADLRLTQENGTLHVAVRDQGVGFDPKQVSPERFGLRGIRERARLHGGTARIESAPGGGTAVYAQFQIDVDRDQPM